MTAWASSGVIAWRHPASGTVSSLPSRPTTFSIAIGLQNTPSAENAANAAAMVSGATSLVPITPDGTIFMSAPSARCTPSSSEPVKILHRLSLVAMSMKALLTEFLVASSTVM